MRPLVNARFSSITLVGRDEKTSPPFSPSNILLLGFSSNNRKASVHAFLYCSYSRSRRSIILRHGALFFLIKTPKCPAATAPRRSRRLIIPFDPSQDVSTPVAGLLSLVSHAHRP